MTALETAMNSQQRLDLKSKWFPKENVVEMLKKTFTVTKSGTFDFNGLEEKAEKEVLSTVN